MKKKRRKTSKATKRREKKVSDKGYEGPVSISEERALAMIANKNEEPAVRLELMASYILNLHHAKLELYQKQAVLEGRLAALARAHIAGDEEAFKALMADTKSFLGLSAMAPIHYWRFVEGASPVDCVEDKLSEVEQTQLAQSMLAAAADDDLEEEGCKLEGECKTPNRCTMQQQCLGAVVLAANNPGN